MIDQRRLTDILDLLLRRGVLHAGQRQDVLNRGRDLARHILLDKRAEMRRLLGRARVAYQVSEIELIAAFRFKRTGTDVAIDEELITKEVSVWLGLPYVHLDPLQLDYKLVTESFGGPFAERHLVIAVAETPEALTLAVADPWQRELFENIARVKNKAIRLTLAQKAQVMQVIVEFHGFRRSMRAAEKDFASDLPDLGNLEQLTSCRGPASSTPPISRSCARSGTCSTTPLSTGPATSMWSPSAKRRWCACASTGCCTPFTACRGWCTGPWSRA